MALRLDDHIVEGIADHVQIIRVTAADESGEIGRLPDEIRPADVGLQDRPRLARTQEHMRVDENAAQRGRNGYLFHARLIDTHRQYQPTEQARCNVIDVRRAAGDDFALHGELEQLQARHRYLEQRIGGDHRRHGRCRRTAHARSQWNALVDIEFKPVSQLQGGMHRLHRASGGVALGLDRQVARHTRDGANSNYRFIDSAQPYAVADGFHRMPQYIEADADIGDGGWSEGGNVGEHGNPRVDGGLEMRAEVGG